MLLSLHSIWCLPLGTRARHPCPGWQRAAWHPAGRVHLHLSSPLLLLLALSLASTIKETICHLSPGDRLGCAPSQPAQRLLPRSPSWSRPALHHQLVLHLTPTPESSTQEHNKNIRPSFKSHTQIIGAVLRDPDCIFGMGNWAAPVPVGPDPPLIFGSGWCDGPGLPSGRKSCGESQ